MVKALSEEASSQKLTSAQILRQYSSKPSSPEKVVKKSYPGQQKNEAVVRYQNNDKNSPRIPEHIEFSNIEATSATDPNTDITDAEERLLASIKAENLSLLKELLSTGEFKQFLESETKTSNAISSLINNNDDNAKQARDEDSSKRSSIMEETKKKYEEEIMKYKHALEESKRQQKLVEVQCTKKVAVFQRKCNESDRTITSLEKDLASTEDKLRIMKEEEDNLKQSLSTLQRANRHATSEKEKIESDIVNCQDEIEAIIKSKNEMEDEKNNAHKENSSLKEKIMELERTIHSQVMQLEKSKKSNLKIEQSRVKSELNLKDCKKQLDLQKDHECKLDKEIIKLNKIINNLQKENESLKVEEDRFMLLQSEKDILQGVLDQSTESFESCLNAIQSKVLEEKEKAHGLNKEIDALLNVIDKERCYHIETKAKLLNANEYNTILELEKELCSKEILDQLEKYEHKVNEVDLLNASKQLVDKELTDLTLTYQSKVNEYDLLKESKDGLLHKASELQRDYDDLQDEMQMHKTTISNLKDEVAFLKTMNEQNDSKMLEMSFEIDAALSIGSTEIMDLNDQVAFLKVIIEERDGTIQDHEVTITTLNDQIASLKAINDQRDDAIHGHEDTISNLNDQIASLQAMNEHRDDTIQSHEDRITDLNHQIESLQAINEQKDGTIQDIKLKTDAAFNVYKTEISKNGEMVNNLAMSLTETSKGLEMSNKETQRLKKALVDNKKRYRGHSLIKNETALLSIQFNMCYLHLINEENNFDFTNASNELKQVIGFQQAEIENLSVELTNTENVLAKTKESYIEDQHKIKKLFNERENQMIRESMKVGTTLKSQIAQLQSEIDDKVNQLATAGDNIVFMEDEVAAVKAELEVQKKTSCDLQNTLQNMDEEYKDLHNSLQMFEKGLGKEITQINQEFSRIKEAFSEFKNIISKNDQDVINMSNEIEQVKTSYEKEKEENDQTLTELKYELQVANRNLDESTTTKCSLVSKNEELQASIVSLQKELKASKLHSKKQQEIICELKSNFSKIISRFETNLTKSISVGAKTKSTVAKINADRKS